jgi:multisubunit Na+/H+ antiporter MnhE subunit
MSKYIKSNTVEIIKAVITESLIFYIFGSLVSANFNPMEWYFMIRMIVGFFWVMVTGLIIMD